MRRFFLAVVFLVIGVVGSLGVAGALAQDNVIRIGYISLEDDPRYDEDYVYARIQLRPQGQPVEGARLALNDMKISTDARGLSVVLDEGSGSDDNALLEVARRQIADGARFIVMDLPADRVAVLSSALSGEAVTLLNTTARDDWLRRRCYPLLLHSAASDRMVADAMTQYLRLRNWTRVLVLVGKTPVDAAIAAAFESSATRLRLDIVTQRAFDLSTNPQMRDENNIQLLTGGAGEYDVVYIADSDGEFGRYVSYQTSLARPVLGTTGLSALEWHWSLERYGAPQVNSRFEKQSDDGRRMGWQDWSTWIATRAVLTAYVKSRDPSPEGILAFLKSAKLRLDGSKGVSLSFRDWDGQLRMPILLATHNAIIGIAPLEGFLHQSNTLDSLGTDAPEFMCD